MELNGEAEQEFAPDEEWLRHGTPKEGLAHCTAQSPALPLLQLDPRQFETLAFLILRNGAGSSAYYDDISLLPTGADKGRDIILRRKAVTGIVQCKRLASRMGREKILTEIMRLALYAVRDPSLRPAPGTRYELWTASPITDDARRLIDAEDAASIIRREAPAVAAGARRNVASLAQHASPRANEAEEEQAVEIATGLTLAHVGPEEIAHRLASLPELRRRYFRSPGDAPPSASLQEVGDLLGRLGDDVLHARRAARRHRNDPYVGRPALDAAFASFLDDPRRAFLVVGGSGQGKTSWVAQLLSSPASAADTVVIPAEQIARADTTPVATIARLLQDRPLGGIPPERMEQAIWSWLDGANRLLVVDGLDRVVSDVRPGLASWLEAAARITRNASVRVVLTTRREAWAALSSATPMLLAALFAPDGQTIGATGSVELPRLAPDEAEAVYKAYGVSSEQHRGARLTSPALIALFSRIQGEKRGIITRLDILKRVLESVEAELLRAGLGGITTAQTLRWIGQGLLGATDGWIPLGNDPRINSGLEELIRADTLLQRSHHLRVDMDDFAELLLASQLDPTNPSAFLDTRREDAIFLGAESLAIAVREEDGGLDETLGRLLDDAPQGASRRLDVACRAILELRSPLEVRHRIEQAIQLWNQDNLLLIASGLGQLLVELDVPGQTLLELILPMIDGEDSEDWQDKFWRGDQRGRMASPFAAAAERAAALDPEGLMNDLVTLSRDPDRTRSSVGRMLLFRAAAIAPGPALQAGWALTMEDGKPFRIAQSASPAAAATFLSQVDLPDLTIARYVIGRLEISAHKDGLDLAGRASVVAAADRLLGRVSDLELKAWVLVLRLKLEQSTIRRAELERLWSNVRDHLYWDALAALGDKATSKLTDLLEGREGSRDVQLILRSAPPAGVAFLDAGQLVAALHRLLDHSPDLSPDIARLVELLLYDHRAPELPELESLALRIAASEADDARGQLIYYAGSVVHGETNEDEIVRRERILDVLVERVSGDQLSTLVWKIVESALERPQPQRRLDALAERFGTEEVLSHMKVFRFLPAFATLSHHLSRTSAG